ncbi:siderophore-interacting protein [Sphingobacterium psychroaquaticum]|uniref:siderophore-interacting protein n=1 Tax=Sphingobacterium psychroaquaticum TaxID=561061 RepID=UPI00106C7C69|nr:siderophore-interacting protein [Sphingobacterium psychroaquaticum]QBQ41707.1 siderophore-interacting protein [Sphingobacterium psychroaquaticum]
MNETKKIRSLFTVKDKIQLTPHMIRVIFHLSDEHVELLAGVRAGSNNKLFVPQKKNDKEMGDMVMRTYTNRVIDFVNRELWIDFVAHGENGPAGAWAMHAVPGDMLEVGMKESVRPLVPEAKSYLLVGDATALPVIRAILEQLPAATEVEVIMEVHGTADEAYLADMNDTRIHWLHNPEPEQGSKLAEVVERYDILNTDPSRFIYVAAEYNTAKVLREYFRGIANREASSMYITSYWKAGEAEDESSARRKEDK